LTTISTKIIKGERHDIQNYMGTLVRPEQYVGGMLLPARA